MTFVIHRIVGEDDLLKRPRVSAKISEYVFGFINDHLLRPSGIMQSDNYLYDITLSFDFEIPQNHKITYKSPYSTELRLFVPQKGFSTFEKTTKMCFLSVVASDLNQEITPWEYAVLVYRMYGDFLLFNFRRLQKEDFDQLESQMDFTSIEKLPFPASFEEQNYIEHNKEVARQKYVRHYGR